MKEKRRRRTAPTTSTPKKSIKDNGTNHKNSNKSNDKNNKNGNNNGKEQVRPEDKPLTPKQELFVCEYLIDFNITQAAIRAGYSKRSAAEQGGDLLRKPHIKKAVGIKAQKLLDDRTELAAKTMNELEVIGRSDITDFVVIGTGKKGITYIRDLDDIDTRAIASMEVTEEVQRDNKGNPTKIWDRKVKIKLWDKTRPLDTLSKVTNLQVNELTLKGTLNLKVSLVEWKKKVKDKLLKQEEKKGKK